MSNKILCKISAFALKVDLHFETTLSVLEEPPVSPAGPLEWIKHCDRQVKDHSGCQSNKSWKSAEMFMKPSGVTFKKPAFDTNIYWQYSRKTSASAAHLYTVLNGEMTRHVIKEPRSRLPGLSDVNSRAATPTERTRWWSQYLIFTHKAKYVKRQLAPKTCLLSSSHSSTGFP